MTEFELQRYLTMMKYCVELSKKGQYTCLPNPQVGCVIENEYHKIIGEGWHESSGQPHAEVNAINIVSNNSNTSNTPNLSVYITLEPCCYHHEKKTPACTDALIALKPKKIVILMLDCNPHVAGKGVEKLRHAGMEVIVLENEMMHLELETLIAQYRWNNRHYIHYIKHKTPYITLKTATSLDGKIALKNGTSKWITNEKSRMEVQKIRAKTQVILTGMGTFLADNPTLNVRDETLRNLPFFKQPKKWLWHKNDKNGKGIENFENFDSFGILTATTGEELYTAIHKKSNEERIAHLLIEGGAGINSILLPWVHEIIWFQAPKIIGSGLSPFDKIDNEVIPFNQWQLKKTKSFDDDVCRWYVKVET